MSGFPRNSNATRVLLVEPDPGLVHAIARSCADLAEVTACPRFADARSRVLAAPPDVLITNLRLEEYNGLHLVVLVVDSGLPTRCVVHTDRPDVYLAREGQSLGAFFEQTGRLQYCLRSYIRATLPASDRRDPARYDRRHASRGGRRAADGRFQS
jgi:DNA-binding NtrC family response regulator